MITNVNVVIVYVEDQQKVVDFFVDKLGFEKPEDAEMWPGARWVEVRPSGAQTGVSILKASDFQSQPSEGYPATFSCDDLKATHKQLSDAGVNVSEIKEEPWGSYCEVSDPEGRNFMMNDRQ